MMIRMAEDTPGPTHHTRFDIAASWIDRIAVLSVRGPLDMLSAPRLSDAINDVFVKVPAGVIVDLTEVDFLASVGMSVLIAARDWAAAVSASFGVVADGAATSRPMRLLGIDAVLALHPTLDDALRTVR